MLPFTLEVAEPAIENPLPLRVDRLVFGSPWRMAFGPVGALIGTSTTFTGGCIAPKLPPRAPKKPPRDGY